MIQNLSRRKPTAEADQGRGPAPPPYIQTKLWRLPPSPLPPLCQGLDPALNGI